MGAGGSHHATGPLLGHHEAPLSPPQILVQVKEVLAKLPTLVETTLQEVGWGSPWRGGDGVGMLLLQVVTCGFSPPAHRRSR